MHLTALSRWSRSIVTGGRDASERLDAITGMRSVAGCATPIGFAGHAPASAPANSQLTFHPDHSMGPINLASGL